MVLGISLGTSRLGYVVIRKGEVVHWGTRCFRGTWQRKKLTSILHEIDQLIDRFGVTQLAIKESDTPPRHKAPAQLIGALNVLLENRCLSVQYYSLHEIKKEIAGDEKQNKQNVFYLLWRSYPELLAGKLVAKTISHSYYVKLFEAAAVAHIQAKGKGNSFIA